MLPKEKFKKIAKSEVASALFLPFNLNVSTFMDETIECWQKQGLAKDADLMKEFGFDMVEFISAGPYMPVPAFEKKIISDDGSYIIMQNEKGATVKVVKDHQKSTMPQWLEYPIKNRADFRSFAKRLNAKSPERYPSDIAAFAESCKLKTHPIGIAAGSFYGHTLQQWIGTEELCMLFYDDPSFVHEMMDYLEQFFLDLIKPYLEKIKFDFASFGEDIAFKGKSFLSPKMFKEFIRPHYTSIVEVLRKNGIEIIFVDSDGYIDELVPLWLDAGINGFSPLEVAAGEDATVLKAKYGKDIILAGNFDKRALIAGPQQIDMELKKIKKLLDLGGVFPMVDHSVPPDVPLENFRYYLEKIKSLC